MLNAISEKDHLVKATKDKTKLVKATNYRTKLLATNQIYLISLGVSKEMRKNQPLVETSMYMNRALYHCLSVPVETIRHRRKISLVHHLLARDLLITVKEYLPRFTKKSPGKL